MREVLDFVQGKKQRPGVLGSSPATQLSSDDGKTMLTMTSDVNRSSSSSNVVREGSSVKSVVVTSSTLPGYLDLTADQAARLIRTEPLTDHYDVEDEPFARGKYATVRRCRHRATGRQFAAKFLRKRRRSADLRAEIVHEVAVLEACKGTARVVRLHEVYESTQDMVLLLELACGGELQMLLDRDEVPSEHQVLRLMRQILDGLIHLHSIDVAHLDIKPQNLVLTGQFPDCDVKLCDFGISRYLSQGADVREILGTPDYVAPEVLNYEPISLATDMWSVGVLLYVLLTGCSPFGGDTKQETFCNIAQCRLDFPDDIFEDISEEAKDLMRRLMVKVPSKRLSAAECLQHAWFTKVLPTTTSKSLGLLATSATTPRTPTLSKRPAPTLEHSEERSLSLDNLENIDTISDKSVHEDDRDIDLGLNDDKSSSVSSSSTITVESSFERSATVTLDSTTGDAVTAKGLSAERKRSFMKNMECLVQKLNDTESKLDLSNTSDNSNSPFSDERTKESSARVTTSWIKETVKPKETRLARVDSFRSMTRASGMQTMPVSGFLRYKVDRSCNVYREVSSNLSYNDGVVERGSESVFKFRRVFILDDSEDGLSPPPSINGSLSSDNSSISDSNSDTISELSIDSSSDRSSIISLDDSLDFVYGKGLSHTRHYSASCYNVWEAVKNHQRSPAARVWPRECSGSFARALSKFSESNEVADLKEGNFHRQRKSLTIFNGGSPKAFNVNSPKLSPSATSSPNSSSGKKCVGLELMRERNGNLVVIREVKAVHGSKFPRCSEVKCESVQSRIRRLQVQNGIQTELAKEQRYTDF